MSITQLVLASKNFKKLEKLQAYTPLMFYCNQTVLFINAIISVIIRYITIIKFSANNRILRDSGRITAFYHTLPHFTTLLFFNIMFSRYDSLGAHYQNIKFFHALRFIISLRISNFFLWAISKFSINNRLVKSGILKSYFV